MPNGLPAAAIIKSLTEASRSASTSTAGTDPACINADTVYVAALAGMVLAAAGVSWSGVAAAACTAAAGAVPAASITMNRDAKQSSVVRSPIIGIAGSGSRISRAPFEFGGFPITVGSAQQKLHPSNSVHDILIRGGLLFDGSGARACRPISRSRTADRRDRPATRRARDENHRRLGPRRRAGLHRHQDPFRLHAADQSQGREQGPPGRHHRDHRPLRLLGRAGAARQGRAAARIICRPSAPWTPFRETELSRLSRQLPGDRR